MVITTNTAIDATDQTVTLSGNPSQGFRLFYVKSTGSLTLTHVILSGGGGKTNLGGAIYVEPGGTLVAADCSFIGNIAAGTNGAPGTNGLPNSGTGHNGTSGRSGSSAMGGAIFNLGFLSVSNCSFFTNSAIGGIGGDGGSGGAGGSQGGNGASGGNGGMALGGAIFDAGLSSTNWINDIADCTFAGNIVTGGNAGAGGAGGGGPFAGLNGAGGVGAVAYGGGIINTGICTIERCTFDSNTAQGGNSTAGAGTTGTGGNGAKGGDVFGGGLCVLGATDTNEVINCTFSGNQIHGGNGGDGGPGGFTGGNGGNGGNGNGGGLYNTGMVSILNCTIAFCGAAGGSNGAAGSGPFAGTSGSVGSSRGGGFAIGGGVSLLANSILATNFPGTNLFRITGALLDAGYNISSDSSPALTNAHSLKKTDANIGTLSDNGGLTQTIPLLAGSRAIDFIPVTSVFPDTDQRGVARPVGAGAEAGSVEVGPAFLEQPGDQKATIGGSATFSVDIASQDPTFQWQLHGTNLPGATDTAFTATNLTDEIRGPYRVLVTDSLGTSVSEPANVNFTPVFLSPPVNVTATASNQATFTAVGAGDTNLVFRWFFGTNLTASFTNTGTQITNSVSFTTVAITNNVGNYTLSVSNRWGILVSSPFALAIGVAPSIASPPADVITNAGSIVIFSVSAAGTPTPGYQWSFNGTDLGGQNGSSYTLANVQATNQGTYSVTVSNSVATNTASATLTVISTPSILSNPVSQTVNVGNSVSLTVAASGVQPLLYQWQRNGANIGNATASVYTINSAQTNDSGNYRAVVTNSFGSATSQVATLAVVPVVPVITVQPVSQTVPVGSDVALSVGAIGAPTLSYTWRMNNSPVGGAVGPSYGLSDVQPEDAGSYDVIVANGSGSVRSAKAVIKVFTPALISATLGGTPKNLNLSFPSQTGFSYTVQYSSDPRVGPWNTLINTNGTGLLIAVKDPTLNQTSRFYRVMVQ